VCKRLLVSAIVLVCWFGYGGTRSLPDGKVLLDGFTIKAKKRLFGHVGLTNITFCDYGERDSKGDRLCFAVEVRDVTGRKHDHLVVVTTNGVHKKPWHIYNEKMTDNEELAVWEERSSTNSVWRMRNGERLPVGYYPESVSAEWIGLISRDRRPWLAKLDTPTIAAAELPATSRDIDVFANGETVHVFARPGWRNADGPMTYLIYDFTRGSKPIVEKVLPWARSVWDMDPSIGIAVVNDNNSFWGKIWLLDLKTAKRKWISADWPALIVKKEVAQKWTELTRP
jgi:hypothetical protein